MSQYCQFWAPLISSLYSKIHQPKLNPLTLFSNFLKTIEKKRKANGWDKSTHTNRIFNNPRTAMGSPELGAFVRGSIHCFVSLSNKWRKVSDSYNLQGKSPKWRRATLTHSFQTIKGINVIVLWWEVIDVTDNPFSIHECSINNCCGRTNSKTNAANSWQRGTSR